MIRVTVETGEELELVRDFLIKPVVCHYIDNCAEKYENCRDCMKDNGNDYIRLYKRQPVEIPQPIVV